MLLLLLGLIVFLGIHSLAIVAPGWRDAQAERNELAWKLIYSLISAAGLVLIVVGYGQARLTPVALYVPPTGLRHAAMLLMLPALVLLAAAYLPGRIRTATKHPMLLATKLWAVAHLLANGNLADVLLFGSFLVWALCDRLSLAHRTPRAVRVLPPSRANDAIALLVGLALYALMLAVGHRVLVGVPLF